MANDQPAGDGNSLVTDNVKITAREGVEDVAFMEATNYSSITFENVQVEGYNHPKILAHTEGKLDFTDTTKLTIEKQ